VPKAPTWYILQTDGYQLSTFLECSLEPVIRLLHVKQELPELVVVQLLRRSHLVQRYEPLHNLSLAFKFLICDLVDTLNYIDEVGVQHILLGKAELESIEQRDEIFGSIYDERGIRGFALLVRLVGWALLTRRRYADTESFRGTRAVHLACLLAS